ncbi:MAG: cytochrome c [Sphingobium sp.]|nr:cytochrome c [Sphingobium sp.]
MALLGLTGCQQAEKKAPHTINETMALVMEPNAEAIWGMMSKAYNDKGDALDPAKLSNDDWKKIGDASALMNERAQELIDHARDIEVTAKGTPIMGEQAVGQVGPAGKDWDAVNAKTIEGRIRANPDQFVTKARLLLDATARLKQAAASKNVAVLYAVGSEMDEVCDGCHEPFWGTDEPPPFPKSTN